MGNIKNKTTLTAAVLLLVTMIAGTAMAEDARDYVGSAKCKMCHNKAAKGAQYTKWQEMKHSKAFATLATGEALEVAKAAGLSTPPAESPECLKCHVTTYDVEKKATHAKIKPADGVQCESCHGPASLHLLYGRAAMMKKDATADLSKNIDRPDEKKCIECHNDKNPSWNPEKYTLEDGKKVGFDFKQAYKKIAHPNPEKAKKE